MKKDIFDEYAKTIAKKFHISIDEMFSKNRRRDIIDARQMLYYLCIERQIRISYIKRFMEENGHSVTHSNIIYSYKKAKELIDGDSDFQELIKIVKQNIGDEKTPSNINKPENKILETPKDRAIEELKKLKELLDLELITKEEFDKRAKELKKIILNN